MSDSTKLKFALTLQGFCPLFVLIFLRYLNRFHLIIELARRLFHGEFGAILIGIRHPEAGGSLFHVRRKQYGRLRKRELLRISTS